MLLMGEAFEHIIECARVLALGTAPIVVHS